MTIRSKADRVGVAAQHAQVGQRVLDLAPLVEARSADELVADGVAQERLLDRPALRVRAVHHRDVAQSRAIEEAFLRYAIRYQLIGGTHFYQRREVKDALAYTARAATRTPTSSLPKRIVNVPAGGIGNKAPRGGPPGGGEGRVYWAGLEAAADARPRGSPRGPARHWPTSSAS